MGVKSFLKKAGNVVSKGLKYASPVLALTGVGAPLAAGLGALGGLGERLTDDKKGGWKDNLGGAVKGGALGLAGAGARAGLSKLGMFGLGGGGGTAVGGATGDGASLLSRLGGGAKDLMSKLGGDGGALGGLGKLGGLFMGGMAIKDQRDQRASSEEFEAGKFDLLKEALGKGEAQYDAMAPMRSGGMDAMLAALGSMKQAGPGPAAEHFQDLKAGKRRAGEYG